jgi:hypothetical protein
MPFFFRISCVWRRISFIVVWSGFHGTLDQGLKRERKVERNREKRIEIEKRKRFSRRARSERHHSSGREAESNNAFCASAFADAAFVFLPLDSQLEFPGWKSGKRARGSVARAEKRDWQDKTSSSALLINPIVRGQREMKEPSPVILLSEKNGQKIGKKFAAASQASLAHSFLNSLPAPRALSCCWHTERKDESTHSALRRETKRAAAEWNFNKEAARRLHQNRSRSQIETMEIIRGGRPADCHPHHHAAKQKPSTPKTL